jgi:hypothetical protein
VDWTALVGLRRRLPHTISFVPQILKIWKTKSAGRCLREDVLAVACGFGVCLLGSRHTGISLGTRSCMDRSSLENRFPRLALAILILKLRFGLVR